MLARSLSVGIIGGALLAGAATAEALMRCAPHSFTPGLAGAIAGRPFAWRIVDHRKHRKA